MPATRLGDCEHVAFISYSHNDNVAWRDWVTEFQDELRRGLESRCSGVKVQPTYFDELNGPVNGPLSTGLCRAIAKSFAIVIFVHDGYVASRWCLHELEYFREVFGAAGFADRVYLVAMSKPAIEKLVDRPAWKALVPHEDQVWVGFYQSAASHMPVDIYADDPRKRRLIISNQFWDPFVKLRERLVGVVMAAHEAETAAKSYPLSKDDHAARDPADRHLVKIYIESNREQEGFWTSLQQQVVASWDEVVQSEPQEPPLRLRPTGLPMTELDERPLLDDADGVVLLWGSKTPDSLAAQILQVEPKLSGPEFAPGLVAYLMAEGAREPGRAFIQQWPVARFITHADHRATVLPQDAPVLERFLRDVLARKRGRAH